MLILRPEPGAAATAKRAAALGLSPMIRSLFAIEPRTWGAPDPALFDSILLTSANAVRFGGDAVRLYRASPVFAVGAATGQAAHAAGFRVVNNSAGNASDALHALAEAGHSRPLHLSGEDRTPYPQLSFGVTTRTVYAALPVDVSLPIGRCAALVHSARAATRFAKLCNSPPLVDVIAISASVAEAAGTGWRSMAISSEPTDNAMLALAAALCEGQPTPNGST